MNAQQLYKHLGTLISCGCADYQIVFMQAEKYPHAVGSVSPDHAGKTIDLCPYGEEEDDDSQYTPEPLQDNCPPVFPQEHFLKWVTIYRPQTYNELLREYYDFCKDNPEKAAAL